ncbi:MAG: LysR family transcriptional regulator [Hydrogenibacillus sp.]|nr:LysR family transcriptional regulator [Hydrogenibacillus sp.]
MRLPFQVFVAVYELKNFTRAAERLYLTQPAVSGHQQLEATFGVQLFTRSPRKVVPTAAGEAHARAKRLLAEYDAMVAELERFQASLWVRFTSARV